MLVPVPLKRLEMSWFRSVDLASAAIFTVLPAAFLLGAELVIGVSWRYVLIPVLLAIIGLLVWRELSRADEGRPLSREHLFKMISLSGAAVAAIAVTGAFFESAKREQQKASDQLVLDNCVEATKVTAVFASTYDPSKLAADIYNRFWQAFYGPLIMTESEKIAVEMVEVGKAIIAHADTCWGKEDVTNFRSHAVNVAVACRARLTSGPIAAQDFVPSEFLSKPLQDHLSNTNPKNAIFPAATLKGLCLQ
jgi:hypothetical protein